MKLALITLITICITASSSLGQKRTFHSKSGKTIAKAAQVLPSISPEKNKATAHCGHVSIDTLIKISDMTLADAKLWLVLQGWIYGDLFSKPGEYLQYNYRADDGSEPEHSMTYVGLEPDKHQGTRITSLTIMKDDLAKYYLQDVTGLLGFTRTDAPQDEKENMIRYTNGQGKEIVYQFIPAGGLYKVNRHIFAIVQYN